MSPKTKQIKSGFSMPVTGVKLTPEAEFHGQLIRYANRSVSLPPVPGWSGPIPSAARPVMMPLNNGKPFMPSVIGTATGSGIAFNGYRPPSVGSMDDNPRVDIGLPIDRKPQSPGSGGRDLADLFPGGGYLRNVDLPSFDHNKTKDPMSEAIAGVAAAIPGQIASNWASRASANAMLAAAPGGPMSTALDGLGFSTPYSRGPMAEAMGKAVDSQSQKPSMSLLPGIADIFDGGTPSKLAGAIGTQGAHALLNQTNLKDIPGGGLVADALAKKVGDLLSSDDPLGGLGDIGCFDTETLEDLGQQIASGLVSPKAIGQMLEAAGLNDIPGAGPVAKALGKELQDAMKDGLGGLTDLDLGNLADSLGDALISADTINQLLDEAGLSDIPGIGAVSDALSDEIKSLIDGNDLGDSFDLDDFAANAFDKAADQLLDMWEVDDNSSALEHIANKMVKDNSEFLKDAVSGMVTDSDAFLTDLQGKIEKFFNGLPLGTGQPCAHVGSKDNLSDVLIEGCPQVFVGGLYVSRVGDKLAPSTKKVLVGSPTVLTGGKMTAFVGSLTEIPSKIDVGNPTVLIGLPPGSGSGGGAGAGGSSGGGSPSGPSGPASASGASSQAGDQAKGIVAQEQGGGGVQGDNAGKSPLDLGGEENPLLANNSFVEEPEEEKITAEQMESDLFEQLVADGMDPADALDHIANQSTIPPDDPYWGDNLPPEEEQPTELPAPDSAPTENKDDKSDLETLGDHIYDDTVGTAKAVWDGLWFTGEQLGEMAKDPAKAYEDFKRGAGVVSDAVSQKYNEVKQDFDRGIDVIKQDPQKAASILYDATADKVQDGIEFAKDKPLTTTYEAGKIALGVGLAKKGIQKLGKATVDEVSDALVAKNTRNIVDKSWKDKISGTAQKTGTDGHQFRTYREAIKEAKKPNVESVHLDHGYNRGLDLDPKTISPNRRPDVLSVYDDKSVARIEVKSKTDDVNVLRNRNAELDQQIRDQGYNPRPPKVVTPTRSTKK